MTDAFIGKWTLQKSEHFDTFLEYYGYDWVSIGAASVAPATLMFESTARPNVLERTIESIFHSSTEKYTFDGKYHKTFESLDKCHTIRDGVIHSEVHKGKCVWVETITVVGETLTVKRQWNKVKTCVQIFTKNI